MCIRDSFWSLAVEEQFYVIMPLLAIGIYRLTRSLRAIFWLFLAGALASAAWTWHLIDAGASIDRLYYGTDTRAAELLVGCLLALGLRIWPVSESPRARTAIGVVGTIAYAISLWVFFTVPLNEPRAYRCV